MLKYKNDLLIRSQDICYAYALGFHDQARQRIIDLFDTGMLQLIRNTCYTYYLHTSENGDKQSEDGYMCLQYEAEEEYELEETNGEYVARLTELPTARGFTYVLVISVVHPDSKAVYRDHPLCDGSCDFLSEMSRMGKECCRAMRISEK